MQGIIADFKEQKEKERLQKLEEQTRQYVDEYQSLALRCNALNSEYFVCHAWGSFKEAVWSLRLIAS